MKHNPRNSFSKKPLAAGIAAALSMTLLVTNPAQAARFELGDVQISFDSTFSLGTSIRTEDRNWNDNVGKSNNLNNGFDFSQYHPVMNPYPASDTIWQGAGSYSNNGDNGGLNFDAGESFSQLIKGSHELDVNYGNFGVFVRGMYYYDFAMMNSDRDWTNQLTGEINDPCDDKKAREQVCKDVRLLDAYAYGDFHIGDMPLSVRVGNQVISWGESTLISHGISEINPVDIARLRAPGAELKEAFIPFGAVWASIGVTENINIEGFYQYSWEQSILPPPGSYFSTNDFAGDGGHANNVQLGFTGNPDIDLDYLLMGLNQIGDMVRAGDVAAASQAYLAYPTKVTLRAPGAKAELRPDDGGQYGLRLAWYVPELNDTEFSFYYVNYHSRRPLFSGQMADFTAASIGTDLAYMAQTEITEENYSDNLSAFSQVKLAYPEDIQMYALSFNTNVGTTSVAGEVSFRKDEPLQIDDVELLFAAMPQQLANAGIPGYDSLDGLSQFKDANGNPYGPGATPDGFILSDTLQAQLTLTHLFGPTLGANQFVGLVEIGGININDIPNQSELRLNGPGTARSGEIYIDGRHAWEIEQVVQNGVESNPFPTEFAWGYKAVAKFEYNNLFAGINMNPRIVFSHDVKGITPDPLFMFIEDRKSVAAGISFDYQSRWSADFSYNSFFGGVGTTNKMEDRDYVSFSIKYSI
ncbi:DUF1302 domain-containing protein [Litorilituus lipolyticus]|uniref:DUF1302 domain-containing protein n=1 Tax=Litorilituus lipolyticus TaxID=2491017 RepID=A0A502KS41_9GAMM|nr:DUF1302 domain-containing protein [Litorilituus lipolyticus]TPH12851.1 DUF1302 domain-containing protein [Litorilituus lipolyticus]